MQFYEGSISFSQWLLPWKLCFLSVFYWFYFIQCLIYFLSSFSDESLLDFSFRINLKLHTIYETARIVKIITTPDYSKSPGLNYVVVVKSFEPELPAMIFLLCNWKNPVFIVRLLKESLIHRSCVSKIWQEFYA